MFKTEDLMRKHLITALMLGGLIMLVAGCTNYYRVTDPTTGKAYYTTKVDAGKGGAVKIKDEKTGSTVTLQSSEVKEISKDEYQAGMMAKRLCSQRRFKISLLLRRPLAASSTGPRSEIRA